MLTQGTVTPCFLRPTASRIGSSPSNDARITAPGVAPAHAQIEFVPDECEFYITALDGQVFVNGDEVSEVILHDGDRLEFGDGGPKVRFNVYVPIGAVCKPVHRMLADAREVASVSGGAPQTPTARLCPVTSTWFTS